MTSPRPTRVLTALGWFLAPIVVVRGAVLLLDHPGPVTALGSDNAAPGAIETPQVPVRPVWTESSRAAAKHAAELAVRPFGDPPLYYPPAPEPSIEPEPEPEPEPQPLPDHPVIIMLDASVQLIMTSKSEEIALVDGRPYRVGEMLRSGDWIVQEISSRDRAVVFRHVETGRIEVRRVPITK